jgi:ABC-type uncharacterized transport system ATPase subunit
MKLGETITVEYEGEFDVAALKNIPEILDTVYGTGKIKIVAENAGSILDRILKLFYDVRIKNIDISQPDLEDVFLELAR